MFTSAKQTNVLDASNGTDIHFMLVPSLSCPAECIYCFGPHQGPVMSAKIMDSALDFIFRVTEQTRQQNIKLTFHGGEPLLVGHTVFRQAFDGLAKQYGSSRTTLALQSNLWLLDDEFCRLFREHKCTIGTSLDGPEDLTDLQRGPEYFARTMEGIQKALHWGLDVGCIATFTPLTLSRWREVFDFFLNERMAFSIHASVPQLDAQCTPLSLSASEYSWLLKQMLDYYINHRREVEVSSLDQLCKAFVAGEGKVCTFRDCLGMFLAIDPKGDIYPCQRLCGRPQYRMGNVSAKPTLEHLVNSDISRRMAARQEAVKSTCQDCNHLAYCRGGCPYNAWANGHSDGVKDPYCQAYRDIFDHIHTKLRREIVSKKNFDAFLDKPQVGILRKGGLIDLIRPGPHPRRVARTARRIIGAVELAQGPDMPSVAARLVEMGVCRTLQSAEASLEGLWKSLHPNTQQLNKLYLHVTLNCQLRCTHCYVRSGDSLSPERMTEMPPEAVGHLISQAKCLGFCEVVITGGEPLYHSKNRQLLEVLADARLQANPMKLVLRTNFALPLQESTLVELSATVDHFVVSVDGDESTHDARRGKGTYATTVKNIESYVRLTQSGCLSSHPGRLTLSATLRVQDICSSAGQSVNALGQRLGIHRIRFRPLLPLGRAADWDEPPVSEALGAYADPIELIEGGFHPVVSCGIGQNLYVEPSGDSFPCYAYHQPHAFLGNVIADDLKSIVESRKFRDLSRHTVETNPKCRMCHLRYLCGGACRAWGGRATQHNLNQAPPECDGLRARAKALYKAACEYLELNGDSLGV